MDLSDLNGIQPPLPNGLPAKPQVEQDGGNIRDVPSKGAQTREVEEVEEEGTLINGAARDEEHRALPAASMNRPNGLPVEVRQLTEHFRPFHRLIHRSVQETWNTFSELLDQLIEIDASPSGLGPTPPSFKSQVNGAVSGAQSPQTLEKKDRLLRFQQDRRALFIKLLVLHDWFKKSLGIEQAIELSAWIHEQRAHFAQSADFIGNMKRELTLWQVPNPDLSTAIKVLSEGRVSNATSIGYIPTKPLPPQVIIRTLRDINILLCTRLSLHEQIPPALSKFRIHDGRVTFTVPHEFELDLSIAVEDPSSQFFFIDFRFVFLQCSTFESDRLRDEFAAKANELLRTDGLLKCYHFLHDLTLSFKLSSLRRQALDMARKQWSDSLRIDLINRTLVVHYWRNRPTPKSWIEIGINSGRRRKQQGTPQPYESFLKLRWMREKIEDHDIEVNLTTTPLSLETVLRRVVSRHSSIILEQMYNKMLERRLYADGRLSLELCCSDEDPDDCSLHIQLTRSKYTTLAVEPISGSLVLKPSTSLSGRTEFELNTFQNPAEEGISRMTMLRCLAAEQELVGQASMAEWEIAHAFPMIQYDLRTIFPPNIQRYVLLRQAGWQPDVLIAATFSADDNNLWLLYPAEQSSGAVPPPPLSYHVDGFSSQEEDGREPIALFSKLKEYAAGGIAFKVAERDLKLRKIPYQLSPLPRFGLKFQPPCMKMRYRCALAKRALRPSTLGQQYQSVDPTDAQVPLNKIDVDNMALIQPTVLLRFCGLNRRSGYAVLLAKGRTTAPTSVLQRLDRPVKSLPKVIGDTGDFSITFQVPTGRSLVPWLFTTLQKFEKLLCCLTVLQSFASMHIQSLSLSWVLVRYDQEAELSMAIDSQPSPPGFAIRLLPYHSNPHTRIIKFIEDQVADLRRPLSTNLGAVLTVLTTTRPLLSVFDQLENTQMPTDLVGTKSPSSGSMLRLHVIARTPTHYALQYFDSLPTSRTMIARFEIFRYFRRDDAVWILRPALEQTVSYSRSSFVDDALQRKVTEEIFKFRGTESWLGLDTGASCPIDHPDALIRKTDGLVRAWANDSLRAVLAGHERHEEAGTLEARAKENTTGTGTQGPVASSFIQQQQQQQHPHSHPHQSDQSQRSQQPRRQPPTSTPRPAPVADRNAQNRAAANNSPQRRRPEPPHPPQRPAQQQQQTSKSTDIITLD